MPNRIHLKLVFTLVRHRHQQNAEKLHLKSTTTTTTHIVSPDSFPLCGFGGGTVMAGV